MRIGSGSHSLVGCAGRRPILHVSLPSHSDTWGHNHDFRLQISDCGFGSRPPQQPRLPCHDFRLQISDCGFGISIPHSAFRNLKSSSRFPLRDGPQVVPSALARGLEVGAAPDDPLGGLPHGLLE